MEKQVQELAEAGFSLNQLHAHIRKAQKFHTRFLAQTHCHQGIVSVIRSSPEAAKRIRRSGGIAQAVIEKLGSNAIAKRRPADGADFLRYIAASLASQKILQLRVVVGPVKNTVRYGTYQQADLAEYLALIQLARVVEAIALLYPYGIRVQLVPDDARGMMANQWPSAYGRRYIQSLQQMVCDLQFNPWLTVEDGQQQLYRDYKVADYFVKARALVLNDVNFAADFAAACSRAKENRFTLDTNKLSEETIKDSALQYLIAHRAEILSGMWSPVDALPLVYANHAGNYQLYTLGQGITKLPWQIRLPFTLLDEEMLAIFCEASNFSYVTDQESVRIRSG